VAKPTQFETVPVTELIAKGITPDLGPVLPIVLVVDDELVIADTLAAILRNSGFTAFAAYDAESALDFLETIKPDLLITDVKMPGMNGVELAIEVTKSSPACKILLFSGQASTADLLSTARESGYSFSMLAKPVHPADLLAHISTLIA
jgi:DNA-binding response OmpR family regulator